MHTPGESARLEAASRPFPRSRIANPELILWSSLLLFFASAGAAGAQTIWNTQSDDWFQATNWSSGVPDSATDAQVNNGGTPQVTATGASANNLFLAFNAGDSGNLLVSGTGTLQVANLLAVGYAGTGTMTATNGATISDGTGSVSGGLNSNGTVVVDGVGSTWANSGGLEVGGSGNGTLTISNGGTVTGGECSIVGNNPIFGGGSGSVTVDGSGSTLVSSQSLDIEGGSLAVQNDGAVVSESADVNGSALLDGPGSTWTTGQTFVASDNYGSLTIQNGAVLSSNGFAAIGDTQRGSGLVTVDGAGSRWDNDFDQARLFVGFGFIGTLSISGGGVVSTFTAGVGAGGLEPGELLVDGAGSAFNVRTNLYVGGADYGSGPVASGVGLIQISHDGALTSAATTIFGQGTIVNDGSLTNEGVTISPGGLLKGNGVLSGDVTNAGNVEAGDSIGLFQLEGNYIQSSTGTLTVEVDGPGYGDQGHLSVSGGVTLDGTLEVRFGNGFLPLQGQVFDLLDVSEATSGSFPQITFPDLRSGFQFSAGFENGIYQITALNDGAPAAGFLNISTRAQVGPGEDALIAGFIITGTVAKKVIIRGLGPSLAVNGIPLPGRLDDPALELRDGTGDLISANDNWMDSPQRQEIIDSTIPPPDDQEAAIVATLAPGNYTAILTDVSNTVGIGLVEVYDLGPDIDTNLANISTRGFVATGDEVMIAGFVVDDQSTQVLLRGLGPSLMNAGIDNPLANPTLELHNGNGDVIAFNDDWRETDEAIIQNTGIPPIYDVESAIVATLEPGSYTAILSGQNEGPGVGLIEVYNLR